MQKIVLRIEVLFTDKKIKRDEDGRDFLAGVVSHLAHDTDVQEVHGKIVQYSPNEKQKELLAYADYQSDQLKAETTTERFCRERNMTRRDLDNIANKRQPYDPK
jgi:hypothetical protein